MKYRDYLVTLDIPVRIYEDDEADFEDLAADSISTADHVADALLNQSARWLMEQIQGVTLVGEGEEDE